MKCPAGHKPPIVQYLKPEKIYVCTRCVVQWKKVPRGEAMRQAKGGIVKHKMTVCEELAAKVRGYFTNRYGKVADFNTIPAKMDGDRDLYELATKITNKVIQPGKG